MHNTYAPPKKNQQPQAENQNSTHASEVYEQPVEVLQTQGVDELYTNKAEIIRPDVPENLEELCRENICVCCPERAEVEDIRLRAAAEMENFKRRLQREHKDHEQYVGEAILADLLPALDSLDLAIQYAGADQASASLLQGVSLTRKLLLDALKVHGLTQVGEVGELFNHEIHEAVSEEIRPDEPEDTVIALLQRGYRLKSRLLRPAKVVISRNV